MLRLSTEQIQPFLSPYLMRGWRTEEVVLDAVEVEAGRIRGVLRARAYQPDANGAYHLTVPVVFIWVAQLAIIYACWEQDLDRKPAEIFVRDIQLKCRRSVATPEHIEIVLSLNSKRSVEGGLFYAGSISVDQGAFTGEGRFVLPLEASAKSVDLSSQGVA